MSSGGTAFEHDPERPVAAVQCTRVDAIRSAGLQSHHEAGVTGKEPIVDWQPNQPGDTGPSKLS